MMNLTFTEALQQLRKSVSCSICLDLIQKPVSLPCSHTFCSDCIHQAMKQKDTCPMCNIKYRKNQLSGLKKVEEILGLFQSFLSSYDQRKMKEIEEGEQSTAVTKVTKETKQNKEIRGKEKEKEKDEHVKEVAEAMTLMKTSASSSVSPLPTTALPFKTPLTGKTDWTEAESRTGNSTSSSSSSKSPVIGLGSFGNTSSKKKTAVPANIKKVHEKLQSETRNENFAPLPTNQNSNSLSTIAALIPKNKAKFSVGSLVEVKPRTWSGINKLGGAGKVEEVTEGKDHEFYYKVKYVLDNHREENISEEFITEYEELDRTSRRNKRTFDQTNSTPTSLLESGNVKSRRLSSEQTSPIQSSLLLTGRALQPVYKNSSSSSSMPSTSTASKFSTRTYDKINILLTCIEDKNEIEKKLEKMINLFQTKGMKIDIAHHFTSDVTHIVVSADENGVVKQRTMKYMQGIAFGVWILSSDWILDCIKSQQIMNEEHYEVKTNAKATVDYAAKRSREISSQNPGGKLFHDMVFLLYGGFAYPKPVRSEISDLLEVCGGQIYTSVADFQQHFTNVAKKGQGITAVIVCGILPEEIKNQKGDIVQAVIHEVLPQPPTANAIFVVSAYWVLDSITNYSIQPYQKYKDELTKD